MMLSSISVSPPQEEDDELSDPEQDEKDPEADDEETSIIVKPKSKMQVTQSENLELKVSHKCLSIVIILNLIIYRNWKVMDQQLMNRLFIITKRLPHP